MYIYVYIDIYTCIYVYIYISQRHSAPRTTRALRAAHQIGLVEQRHQLPKLHLRHGLPRTAVFRICPWQTCPPEATAPPPRYPQIGWRGRRAQCSGVNSPVPPLPSPPASNSRTSAVCPDPRKPGTHTPVQARLWP